MARFRMTLRMLSPVHVGTGETLTPESYVIRREENMPVLAAIDFAALISGLSDSERAEFNRAADACDIAAIRRFVFDRATSGRFDLWIAGADEDLENRYNTGLQSKEPSAELAIHPMTRTGHDRIPYIPGSSIKGAIRTAVLQSLVPKSVPVNRKGRRDGQNLEAEILGYMTRVGNRDRAEIRADPFRALRITDASIRDPQGLCTTFVGRATIIPVPGRTSGSRRGPRRPDPSGIQLYYEATFSTLQEGQPAEAVGELAIDEQLARADASTAWQGKFPHPVARELHADQILKACNTFYTSRLDAEAKLFGEASDELRRVYETLRREAAQAVQRGEALLRLGRFSHVECMTLAPPLRNVRGGASRTVIYNCPLGWTALRLEQIQP